MKVKTKLKIQVLAPNLTYERWSPFVQALKNAGHEVQYGEPHTDIEGRLETVISSQKTKHSALEFYKPGYIKKIISDYRPDIVHVFGEPAYNLTTQACNAVDKSMVVTCRSAQNITQEWPYPFNKFEKRNIARLNGIYVVNSDAKRILEKKGFKGAFVFGHNGYEATVFQPRHIQRDIDFIFVGKYAERKGWETLVAAFELLNQVGLKPSLRMIGSGPDKVKIENYVSSHGLNVCVDAPASREELAKFMQRSRFVIIPSQSSSGNDWSLGKVFRKARVKWAEQFCMVAVEALACGTPCISSKNGALPEVLKDTATYFNEKDAEQLSQILQEKLQTLPTEYEELVESSLKLAESYTWEKAAVRLTELWASLR